jgi:hypothetical protein
MSNWRIFIPQENRPTGRRKLFELLIDDLVKIQKSRHSRAGGSPELLDLTGFPLSRE